MALAGASVVWAICTVGFYCLRTEAAYPPGALWHELFLSAAVGGTLAIPLVIAALVLRVTNSTRNAELSC